MAHAEHHDHDPHDEAHDDHHEPPPPEEPLSPWWLPLLGAAIFLTGGIAFLIVNADPDEASKEEKQGAATARPAITAAQVNARPAVTAAQVDARPAGLARPAISALPAFRKALEDAKRLAPPGARDLRRETAGPAPSRLSSRPSCAAALLVLLAALARAGFVSTHLGALPPHGLDGGRAWL
jgi:hypothetical protein